MQKNKKAVDVIDRIIRLPELKILLGGVSTASVYRWVKLGILPKPQRVGVRGVGWQLSKVEEMIQNGSPSGEENP